MQHLQVSGAVDIYIYICVCVCVCVIRRLKVKESICVTVYIAQELLRNISWLGVFTHIIFSSY